MRDYKLARAVPIVWLADLGQPGLSASILPAGTVLDLAPLTLLSDADISGLPTKVRVQGREGFVSTLRLREALPGWKSTSQK